jgi:hypothetical protein
MRHAVPAQELAGAAHVAAHWPATAPLLRLPPLISYRGSPAAAQHPAAQQPARPAHWIEGTAGGATNGAHQHI